ncbi:divalent metal cation transporter [Streptomyces sparsogenes]|uniref:divalent metal cation transporter n=1 Tax=Streptomyces sparsogenes TaxID=67365 RepID=UPI0033C3C551
MTLTPALITRWAGVNPADALVWSQVVLSFGMPFALIPLILLTHRQDLMGPLANRPVTTVTASVVAALVTGLNCIP